MDEIRDIKKTDQLSRFLDSRVVRTNPFGANISGEKAYRRAERIVAGLHLLTSHVPEGEAVRQMVRKTGLQLLVEMLALRDEMRISVSPKTKAVQASVRGLVSLTRILAISGYISFQNADIVSEALDELGSFLDTSQRSALSESIAFSKDDFLGAGMAGHKITVPLRPHGTHSYERRRADTVSDIKDIEVKKDKQEEMSVKARRVEGTNPRAQNILDMLRSGGTLGIRDIASNLPEYSEKMIQRELAQLVAKGTVNKIGSKRWSRYSLAQM